MVMTNALFDVGGQSNAIGIGVGADVSNYPGFTTPLAAVPIINFNGRSDNPPTMTRDPAVSGSRALAPRAISMGGSFAAGTHGIEVTLGKELHANPILAGQVRLFQCGLDGSTMDRWLPGSAFPTGGPSWFDQYVDAIKSAQLTMRASLRLGGIAWLQGTSDALSEALANAYYDNLNTFFRALRFGTGGFTGFGAFAITIDRISMDFINNFPDQNAQLFGPIVRAAQERFVRDNPRCEIVNTDDIGTFDNAHYNSNGLATLGVRHAAALVRIVTDGAIPLLGPGIGLR